MITSLAAQAAAASEGFVALVTVAAPPVAIAAGVAAVGYIVYRKYKDDEKEAAAKLEQECRQLKIQLQSELKKCIKDKMDRLCPSGSVAESECRSEMNNRLRAKGYGPKFEFAGGPVGRAPGKRRR